MELVCVQRYVARLLGVEDVDWVQNRQHVEP